MKLTYCQKQAAAVLKTCTVCKVEVYATQPFDPYVCILCRVPAPVTCGRRP